MQLILYFSWSVIEYLLHSEWFEDQDLDAKHRIAQKTPKRESFILNIYVTHVFEEAHSMVANSNGHHWPNPRKRHVLVAILSSPTLLVV